MSCPLLDQLIACGLFDAYVDEAIANMDDDEAEAFFHEGVSFGNEDFDDGTE